MLHVLKIWIFELGFWIDGIKLVLVIDYRSFCFHWQLATGYLVRLLAAMVLLVTDHRVIE